LKVPISGFDVTIRTDPRNSEFEEGIERRIRRHTRRLMEGGGSAAWFPAPTGGSKINFSETIKFDRNATLDGSVSIMVTLPMLGTQGFTESSFESINQDRDVRDRTEAMFDDLMGKLEHSLETKLSRVAWQTEWRQFTSLPRVH
jgi:hypothetical protein